MIEWIKVSNLQVGDVVVSANEVMEVEHYVVDAVDHFEGYSVVNAIHHNHVVLVPSICGGSWATDNRVQILWRRGDRE